MSALLAFFSLDFYGLSILDILYSKVNLLPSLIVGIVDLPNEARIKNTELLSKKSISCCWLETIFAFI